MSAQCKLWCRPARRRRGSAILAAVIIAVVLGILVIGFSQFMSFQISSIGYEAQRYMALNVAEAGLNVALAELRKNYSFATHTMNDGQWGSALPLTLFLPEVDDLDDTELDINSSSGDSGTLQGELKHGFFKVRVGVVDNAVDNPNTPNEREDEKYLLIESVGAVGDTYRKITALVEKRSPGREFLMYDADILSIIFGKPGDSNFNIFRDGNLYGHNGIVAGRILTNGGNPCAAGTRNKILNLYRMTAPNGRIWLFDNIPLSYYRETSPGYYSRDTATLHRTATRPPSSEYVKHPENFDKRWHPFTSAQDPSLSEADRQKFKNVIMDVNDQPPPSLDIGVAVDYYREMADQDGLVITSSTSGLKDYFPVSDDGKQVYEIDFKDFKKSDDPSCSNGVIFSEVPLTIWGNPDKDYTIVSTEDIFIVGDFNQHETFNQSYRNISSSGNQQQFRQEHSVSDYQERDALHNDINKDYHQGVSIVSDKNIWYDFRSPCKVLKKELKAYLEYELVEAILQTPSADRDALRRDVNRVTSGPLATASGRTVTIPSSISSEVIETRMEDYFSAGSNQGQDTCSIDEADDTLIDDIVDKCSDGSLSSQERHELVEQLWTAIENEEFTTDSDRYERAAWNLPRRLFSFVSTFRQNDDNLYYPEMTINAAMWSSARRDPENWWGGPDYVLRYNEIGNRDCDMNYGAYLDDPFDLIQRVFGSEVRLSNKDIPRYPGIRYHPPMRKKIYDKSLPRISSPNDPKTFAVISWQDIKVEKAVFDGF